MLKETIIFHAKTQNMEKLIQNAKLQFKKFKKVRIEVYEYPGSDSDSQKFTYTSLNDAIEAIEYYFFSLDCDVRCPHPNYF